MAEAATCRAIHRQVNIQPDWIHGGLFCDLVDYNSVVVLVIILYFYKCSLIQQSLMLT